MTRVFGVMSTFRPDHNVVERARLHATQINKLIIVDDGSPDSTALDDLDGASFEVIRLAENSGIAKALNVGMEAALDQGADFILNLDQDSVLDDDYMKRIHETFHSAAKATRLGVVLTDSVNHQPSIPPKYSPEGFGLVEEGIQSGLVVSAACLRDTGMLEERLFIDCVDIEFCLRVRDHGWNIAVAPGANITHSLGEQEPYRPFGKQRLVDGQVATFQYHKPFRQYYITRNNIDLCLRNLRRRPRWVVSVGRRELVPTVKTLIGSSQPRKQWLAVTVGTWHGLVRRRGKIPTWLANAVR